MRKQFLLIGAVVTMVSCGAGESQSETVKPGKTQVFCALEGGEEKLIIESEGVYDAKMSSTTITLEGNGSSFEPYLKVGIDDLKPGTYEVATPKEDATNKLASYTLKTDGESNYCCGIMNDVPSKGSLTITEMGGGVMNGEFNITNYDGTHVHGTFSAKDKYMD